MWNRLPIWFRAVLTGLLVAGVPTTVWAVIATLNLRATPNVPWSVPLMAVALWSYWRYLVRSHPERVRVGPVSPRVWRLGLLAGGSGVAAVWALFAAFRGMLHITQPPNALPRLPIWTIAAAIVMASAVAGVAEESGFRGFIQVPMERAYGPAIAIGVTAVVFTSMHLTHGRAILPFLPFFLAVAVVYGLLAYLTRSLFPSMLLHFVGDVAMFAMQTVAARQGVVPPSGVSNLSMLLFCALAASSVLLFRTLARDTRSIPSAAPAVA